MFQQLELFLLGCATVVDTALLLVLLERVNRPLSAVWLRLLILGTWIWHLGGFLHGLLRGVSGDVALLCDQLAMSSMSLGLLILPSAMLHAALRLNHTSVDTRPPRDSRYLLLYLPLVCWPLAVSLIVQSAQRDFVIALQGISGPWLLWLAVADVLSVVLFLRFRRSLTQSATRSFFAVLSAMLLAMTAAVPGYALLVHQSRLEPVARVLATLLPLWPLFLFVWYVRRQKLLPLVLERTFVYGAMLVLVLLLHALVIGPLTQSMQRQSPLNISLVEGLVVAVLIMLWRPLRRRVNESLRYLLSSDILQVRDAIRQLSVALSQQTGRTLPQLCQWLEDELTHRLQVEFVVVRLMTEDGRDSLTGQDMPDESVLQTSLQVGDEAFLDRSRMTDRHLFDVMQRRGILLAFRVLYGAVQGLVLIGDRRRGDRLADEQLSSLVMLFDQWAATVHGRQLEERRVSAERRAMQQEKLSVLGLLAGSLAHELRNPLSSIRTIAVLLLEDLGAEHPRARDVEVIIAEIDRLTRTTQRLLDSARPADAVIPQCSPDMVVVRLMHILGHFARQHHVDVELTLTAGDAQVSASDATLSEILFNLIRNAVEAARERAGGRVRIDSCCKDDAIVMTVADNGAGVPASMTESLFQPFATARPDGTGLGLFVAAERVRELRGTLRHRRDDNAWTVFEVRLPLGIAEKGSGGGRVDEPCR